MLQFMEQQVQPAKAKWAETLGVSTPGYYNGQKDRENRAARDQKIRQIVIDHFRLEGDGTYGADRIGGCARRDDHRPAYTVVKHIMAEEGLKSVHCRRRQRSLTDRQKARSVLFVIR